MSVTASGRPTPLDDSERQVEHASAHVEVREQMKALDEIEGRLERADVARRAGCARDGDPLARSSRLQAGGVGRLGDEVETRQGHAERDEQQAGHEDADPVAVAKAP